MIKFFRKIRQKLLSENKFSKYLIYAVGEIILVVIGILIALQINNWNEQKKERQKETKLLNQLVLDLKYNLNEISDMYGDVLIRSVAKDSILNHLENVERHSEELKMYLHQIQLPGIFNLANTTYKSIESGGIDALSNDTLRAKITDMYEFDFRNVEERRKLEYDMITYRLKPITLAHLIPTDVSKIQGDRSILEDVAIMNFPRNPKALAKNGEFVNVLSELQAMTTARKYFQEKTLIKLEELIAEVEEEIIRLKN
ncbi:MAG: DUF6090 family protein [Bacteroidota bacterium]